MKRIRSAGLVLAACLGLAGCEWPPGLFGADPAGGPGAASPSASPSAVPFRLGTTVTTAVPAGTNAEIHDPASGQTFEFPQGGSGDLVTAPIASGPERPLPGGSGFLVRYAGSQPVRLKVQVAPGERVVLMGYGPMAGSADDHVDTDGRWQAVAPVAEGKGYVTFPLPLAAGMTTAAPKLNWQGYGHYWISRIQPGDDTAKRMDLLTQQANADVQRWLEAMTPARRALAQAAVQGPMRFTVYPDGNYYTGFTRSRLTGNTTTPMLGLKPTVTEDVLAHEVGHYMNHVLAGDAAYLTIEDLAPDENHGLGVVLQPLRSTITEDYAYFSQYFLRGTVGSADPTDGRAMFAGISPAKQDMPGTEGFACALLASLTRKQERMRDFAGKFTEAPTVDAPWADLFEIIAQGPPNVTVLRQAIETYLSGRGMADRLPVMAERIGWSYHGNGKVLGSDNAPVAGATVQSVVTVNGKAYTTPAVTSGADGSFTLERIFPGTTTIRVSKDGVTKDFPSVQGWDRHTDAAVSLGSFTLGVAKPSPSPSSFAGKNRLDYLHECQQVMLHCTYTTPSQTGGQWAYVDNTGYPDTLRWSGTGFTVSGKQHLDMGGGDTDDTEITIRGTLSPDAGTVLDISAAEKRTTITVRNGVTSTRVSTTDLAARNLVFSGSSLGGYEWTYYPGAGALSDYLTLFRLSGITGTPSAVHVKFTRPGS